MNDAGSGGEREVSGEAESQGNTGPVTRKMGLFDEYGEQRAVSRGPANMAEEGPVRAKCNDT